MQIVLYALAAVLMLAGVYGLVMGWDIILVERGWSQFIAGATSFSAGAIILALLHVARQVDRLRGDLAGLVVEVDDTPSATAVKAPAPPANVASEAAPAPITPPVTAESHDAQATAPREMVGSYASGGVTYFMYGDHSIEAELPEGRFRFASMEELRTYLDTGAGGQLVRKGAPDVETP